MLTELTIYKSLYIMEVQVEFDKFFEHMPEILRLVLPSSPDGIIIMRQMMASHTMNTTTMSYLQLENLYFSMSPNFELGVCQ